MHNGSSFSYMVSNVAFVCYDAVQEIPKTNMTIHLLTYMYILY